MPRRRPTIRRAIVTCLTALKTASHRVPLIGLIVGGVLAWLAFRLRSNPPTTVAFINQLLFWLVLIVAACFLLLGIAGFIETITGQRRTRRASTNKP